MNRPPDDNRGPGGGYAGRPASEVFRLRVLPAGKNDRVVEISDAGGNVIKYLHMRYRLGNSVERRVAEEIRGDWQALSAAEFAVKYGIGTENKHG